MGDTSLFMNIIDLKSVFQYRNSQTEIVSNVGILLMEKFSIGMCNNYVINLSRKVGQIGVDMIDSSDLMLRFLKYMQ